MEIYQKAREIRNSQAQGRLIKFRCGTLLLIVQLIVPTIIKLDIYMYVGSSLSEQHCLSVGLQFSSSSSSLFLSS